MMDGVAFLMRQTYKKDNLGQHVPNKEEKNEIFEKEYRKAIGVHHRFTADDKGAIWMWNRFTQFLQQEKGMRILTIAIWVIGIFTLLSGIVGVSKSCVLRGASVLNRGNKAFYPRGFGLTVASVCRVIRVCIGNRYTVVCCLHLV